MQQPHQAAPARPADRRLATALVPLAALVALAGAMWVVELLDTVLLDHRLGGGGIHPRRIDGLDGVLWAPMLHAGSAHLLSNTVPFVALGSLVVAHGTAAWWKVTAGVVLAGGFLVWLVGGPGNHIGASGVVFGYLGFLVGAGFAGRNLRSFGLALLAVGLYGGLAWGLLPRQGVSWESHLFGAVVGAALSVPILGRSPRAQVPST